MDFRRLAAAEARRLDAAGHPKSHQAAVLGYTGRIRTQLVDDELEQARVVAAVVDVASAACWKPGRVRHLPWLDQVAPPQLDRVQVELSRQPVHDALHRVVAEWTAATTDESAGYGVRVDELVLELHRGQHVRRDHVGDDDLGLSGAGAGV